MQAGQYSSPSYRFMFNDMKLFHKVVYKIIPVTMPDYLSEDSRLCSTHLDNLYFVSNIASTTTSISNLNKSFFVATRYGTFYYLIQEIQWDLHGLKLNLLSIIGL